MTGLPKTRRTSSGRSTISPDRDPQELAERLMNPAHPPSDEDKMFFEEVITRLFQPIRDEIMRPYRDADE